MFMDVEHPFALWIRNKLLKAMMISDVYLKFAEKEIIKNSPVPVIDPRDGSVKT